MSEVNHCELPEQRDRWQQTLNWQPSDNQLRQFQHLYDLVLAGNQHLNLTRITEPLEFWEKHLWDSLQVIDSLVERELLPAGSKRVIDIGTGGGFPGLPVAIAQPQWTVTLLDSTRKKVAFLQRLVTTLGLPQVSTLCDRAEHLGHDHSYREAFDLALIRAVGTGTVCAEYALPFLKVGGIAILYRGQWTMAESTALQAAAVILGGTVELTTEFTTPLSQSQRHCLYLRKLRSTPSCYPRAIGIPQQQPL